MSREFGFKIDDCKVTNLLKGKSGKWAKNCYERQLLPHRPGKGEVITMKELSEGIRVPITGFKIAGSYLYFG